MTNSTSEREQRQTDDDLARTVLRPVRGCATDNQYCDALDRALTAFSTIRQEERRAVWSNVFNVVSAEGSFGARQLIKSLEGAREQDGCGPTKAANETRGEANDEHKD